MNTSSRQRLPGGVRGGRNDPAFTELIREELARILSSPMFAKARSLSRLLSYMVEQTLEGHSPNEYSVGVDVFRRGVSFDSKADTILLWVDKPHENLESAVGAPSPRPWEALVTPCYKGEFVLESIPSFIAAIRVFFRSRIRPSRSSRSVTQWPCPNANALDPD
jgi:hypothetical protein